MKTSNPLNEKMQRVVDKLSNVHFHVDTSKSKRINEVNQRMTAVEERMQDMITQYNRKLTGLKDEMLKLQKVIEDENLQFESQYESRVRDIAALESRLSQRFEQEVQNRQEGAAKVQGYLDEKTVYLKSDIQNDGKIRAEQIDTVTQSLENDLPKLYEMIQNEQQDREQFDNGVLRRAGDEIKRLNESLGNQKRLREESEGAIFEMLKDLVSRVKSEIEEEKELREEGQEHLLHLLEHACDKMHAAHKE